MAKRRKGEVEESEKGDEVDYEGQKERKDEKKSEKGFRRDEENGEDKKSRSKRILKMS
jgi:hypothetical protein